MKMGTIASPWRYDVALDPAILLPNARGRLRQPLQFHGPRFAHEKILARALRAVVVGPGCGVKDDCKVCIALTAGRGTQNNVR